MSEFPKWQSFTLSKDEDPMDLVRRIEDSGMEVGGYDLQKDPLRDKTYVTVKIMGSSPERQLRMMYGIR